MGSVDLRLGDNLELLKQMSDNSVDSVVTDPPYGISFMGKKWDYDVPSVELWKEVLRVLKPGGHALVACGTRTQHRMAVNLEDAGFEIRDIVAWVYGQGFPKSLDIGKAISAYDKTGGAKQWEGWGTALKPAMELWTLCRKPLGEKTVAENVLKYGTGGINIDGCRVPLENGETIATNVGFLDNLQSDGWGTKKCITEKTSQGRFPANVIHDGSEEVVSLFPDSKARFFYCAKVSKKERNCDGKVKNNHPTVKPVALMRYLCRLITPPNGVVLDPFMGSGSTGIAALLEGFNFIGMEIEEKYMEIAKVRIGAYEEYK